MKFRAMLPALTLLITSASVSAFDVSPLVIQLKPDGHRTSASIEIRNTSAAELPVELSVHELKLDPVTRSARRGNAADEDLMVFPPAAILSPNGTQSIRLQWIGGAQPLDKTRSFIVAVEQLPVLVDDNEEGVELILTFNAIVHVANGNFRPALEVDLLEKANPVNDISGSLDKTLSSRTRARISNTGQGVAFGERLSLSITQRDNRAFTIDSDALHAERGEIFLPPGSSQVVVFELPADLEEPYDVSVTYADDRQR